MDDLTHERPATLAGGLLTVTFGTILTLVSTICLIGFGFLSRILIVRNVSIGDWDAFALSITILQILGSVAGLGIPVAVARTLPAAKSELERRTVIRTALTISATASVASGASLALIAPVVAAHLGSAELRVSLDYFSVVLGATVFSASLVSIFQGFSSVVPNALFLQVMSPAMFFALLCVAFLLPPHRLSYGDALGAYLAANVAALVGVAVYTAYRLPYVLIRGPVDPARRRELLRLAAPLLVVSAMVMVAGTGDTLVLGALHYGQIGTYMASLTLARMILLGVGSASYIFLPVASKLFARSEGRAVAVTYATVTKWLVAFSLPLFILFVILPGSSLAFVYGVRYSSVVQPLRITAAGAFAASLLGPASMALIASGKSRVLASNAVVAGLLDVVLAVVLVPGYGANGAAASWAASTVVYAALCFFSFAATQRVVPVDSRMATPLALVVIPSVLVLSLGSRGIPVSSLPALGLGLGLAFVLAVLLCRSVGEGERLLLEGIEETFKRRFVILRALGSIGGRARSRTPRGGHE